MSKFIKINMNLNLEDEKWYRNQNSKIDNILGKIKPIDYFTTIDEDLSKKGIIEIKDKDIDKLDGIKYSIFQYEETPHNFITTEKLWDRFSDAEKILLMDSKDSKVRLFMFEIQIKKTFNLNSSKLKYILTYLEEKTIS